MKPGKGLFQIGCFVAVVLGLCGVVSMTYPDMPSYPREFEDGLEKEMGGSKVVKVSSLFGPYKKTSLTCSQARVAGDPFP